MIMELLNVIFLSCIRMGKFVHHLSLRSGICSFVVYDICPFGVFTLIIGISTDQRSNVFFWLLLLTKHLLWWEMLLVGKGGPIVVKDVKMDISSVLPSYVNLGIKKKKTKKTGHNKNVDELL